MLDYDKRLNEAWEKVPEQHKKEMLEQLEHQAYQQDFQPYDNDGNIIEVVVDAIINVIKTIFK